MIDITPAHRLLAIEDNQSIADMICRAASDVGFDSCSANGLSAVSIYHHFQPSVIVLDILMPEMDGLEFLKFLEKQYSKARIIILSGSSDTYRSMAENMGTSSGLKIVGNISKPFRIKEVRELFENILASLPELRKQGGY